jgi:hypothetical protein
LPEIHILVEAFPEFFKINKDRPYVKSFMCKCGSGNVLFAELKETLFDLQIIREMQLTNVILEQISYKPK